jgi:hypothetical protein
MSSRLPRRGPHRQAAARQAGARLWRLAAVLAALTCGLLASTAAVPAAFATTLPDGGPLAAGVPATATAQQPGKPSSPASSSPCSEVCSGGGYGLGAGDPGPCSEVCSGGGYGLGAGDPGPCSEVCSGGGYGLGAGHPGPCSEVCSGGGYGSVSPPSGTPADSSAGNTAGIPPTGARHR